MSTSELGRPDEFGRADGLKKSNGQIILSNMLSIPNEILSKCLAVKIADFKVDIRG